MEALCFALQWIAIDDHLFATIMAIAIDILEVTHHSAAQLVVDRGCSEALAESMHILLERKRPSLT